MARNIPKHRPGNESRNASSKMTFSATVSRLGAWWAGILVTSGYGNSMESENLELTETSLEGFAFESKKAGMNPTSGGKYFLVHGPDIIGGVKLVQFQDYIRVADVFLARNVRQQGWMPRILLLLLDSYKKPLRVRAYDIKWSYWTRYASELKSITPNVKEFQVEREKVENYLKSKERNSHG